MLYKPTKAEILSSVGKVVPDLISKDLKVLFCGINPGLYSGAVGCHFARPGNRFWPALFRSGFTPRLFNASEEEEFLFLGYGITNIVDRATTAASELSNFELIEGLKNLEKKAKIYTPKMIAILGITAFRTAFSTSDATFGFQKIILHNSRIWVLPNPSGLNAHYKPTDLAEAFRELFIYIKKTS